MGKKNTVETNLTVDDNDCGNPSPVQAASFDNSDEGRELLCQKLGNYDCEGSHLWLTYNAAAHKYVLLYRLPEGGGSGNDCSEAWPATLFAFDELTDLQTQLAAYDCGGLHTFFAHNADKESGQYELYVRNPGAA